MESSLNAAIVAIGSELTSGQITNRNAPWLSAKLWQFGIGTSAHLVVDDKVEDVIDALTYAQERADIIFVTGGLGPTSDDLTRHAIASFTDRPLTYDQNSWEHLAEFFKQFDKIPSETNRQQCYFPEGAKILTNQAGTANGFCLETRGKKLYVLPGPPNEIARLWQDEIADELPVGEKFVVKKWRTIGSGESNIAPIVESILSEKGLQAEVSYRAHKPYVETKLKFSEKDRSQYRPLCHSIRTALTPWLYEEDEENQAESLVNLLERFDNGVIDDTATHGCLADLLNPAIRQAPELRVSQLTSWDFTPDPEHYLNESLQLTGNSQIALGIAGFDAHYQYAIGMRTDQHFLVELMPSPYENKGQIKRNQLAIAALALKTWVRWINNHSAYPTTLS